MGRPTDRATRSLATLVIGSALVGACGGDDGSRVSAREDDDTAAAPLEVIDTYRIAYNAGDIDEVMALFTEESTLIDHPTALFGGVGDGGNTLTGVDEIREANVVDRATAAQSSAYEFVNVRLADGAVLWDHRWVGLNGAEWCGHGHRAVISEGRFVTWSYADPQPCSPDCSFADAFDDNPPEACRRS